MDERQMRQPSRFRSPNHQSMTGRIAGAGLVHFRAWEQVQPWVLAARHQVAGREFRSQCPSQRRSPGNRTTLICPSDVRRGPPHRRHSAEAERQARNHVPLDLGVGASCAPSQDWSARIVLDALVKRGIGFSRVMPDRRTCDQLFPLFTFRQYHRDCPRIGSPSDRLRVYVDASGSNHPGLSGSVRRDQGIGFGAYRVQGYRCRCGDASSTDRRDQVNWSGQLPGSGQHVG